MTLLNADELKEAFIEAGQNSGGEWGKNWKLTWEQILDVIDHAQTVDAVEVVRCKDCVHYFDDGCGNTNYDSPAKRLLVVRPDWYCADGKRKEDAAD